MSLFDPTSLAGLPHPWARRILLIIMGALYFGFGFVHVLSADKFLPIMPDWVPAKRLVVIGTGLCEIAGAVGLFIPQLRWLSGVMLAIYAVCVYPANIKHALDHVDIPQLPHSWWYHGPRLAFQPVFVWWALFCSGVIDWPFQARQPTDRTATAMAAPDAGQSGRTPTMSTDTESTVTISPGPINDRYRS